MPRKSLTKSQCIKIKVYSQYLSMISPRMIFCDTRARYCAWPNQVWLRPKLTRPCSAHYTKHRRRRRIIVVKLSLAKDLIVCLIHYVRLTNTSLNYYLKRRVATVKEGWNRFFSLVSLLMNNVAQKRTGFWLKALNRFRFRENLIIIKILMHTR